MTDQCEICSAILNIDWPFWLCTSNKTLLDCVKMNFLLKKWSAQMAE